MTNVPESTELKAPEDGVVAVAIDDSAHDGSPYADMDEAAAEKNQIREDDGPAEPSRGHGLAATKSYATDTSVATTMAAAAPRTGAAAQGPRTWRQRLNPLRWGRIPEVPEERIVSREYGASLLSKLTFEWMTPLMTVSPPLVYMSSL